MEDRPVVHYTFGNHMHWVDMTWLWVGVTHASLVFQGTSHTPHVREEEAPAVWWTGLDGSRLLTAPRGPLNLHQWPEDVERLLARDDLEVRPTTLRGLLHQAEPHAVERRYSLADVFDGVSLGQNGDHLRRLSRAAEHQLLAGEAIASLASRFGRPYPRWSIYPASELEQDGAARQVLSLYDPWDEDYFVPGLAVRVRLVPDAGLRNLERLGLAQEFCRPAIGFWPQGSGGDLPAEHALVSLESAPGSEAGAAIAALYGERAEPLAVEREVERPRIRLALRPFEIVTLCLDLIEARASARDLDATRSVWAQAHRRGGDPALRVAGGDGPDFA